MRSRETFDDRSSTPITRRAVTTGLWAAPVLAVAVASPALAASQPTPTLTVVATGQGVNRRWTVTFANMPTNASISVLVTATSDTHKAVRWVGGSGTPSPTTDTTNLTVVVTGSGSFTFGGKSNPTGTVSSAGAVTQTFS